MSTPVSVLLSMWLLVIGYGLIFIGYAYFASGKKLSFQSTFFPSGLFAPSVQQTPIGNALGGVQNTTAARGGSGFGPGGGAGQGVGGGGGGSF